MKAVQKIKTRKLTMQSRKKSYVDARNKDLKFMVGDHMFLKLVSMKGVLRFGKKGKLNPNFIGPFEILGRIEPMVNFSTMHERT